MLIGDCLKDKRTTIDPVTIRASESDGWLHGVYYFKVRGFNATTSNALSTVRENAT